MSNQSSEQQEPKFVTCRCKTCDGHIEFDSASFFDGETRETQCPFCGIDTPLYVPTILIEPSGAEARVEVPPRPAPAPTPQVQPIWFGAPNSQIKLTLTSGTSLAVAQLKLFDAQALQRLASLKTAATQLGGVSTGLGVIGSFEWVILASAAIGAIESAMTNAMAKQGANTLRDALVLERQIRRTGSFFPIGMIEHVEQASPGHWEVPAQAVAPHGFIHNGEDFIVVKDTNGVSTSIRWSTVETYKYEADE